MSGGAGGEGTLRQRIAEVLREGAATAKDLSKAVGVSEHDVAGHLVHLAKSLRARGERLVMTPPECLDCHAVRAARGAGAGQFPGISRHPGRRLLRLHPGGPGRRAHGSAAVLRRTHRAPAAVLPAQRFQTPCSGDDVVAHDASLPEAGFVFCCFNNNYKITPEVFDVWMRLLKQVEGSVLWLLQDNAAASHNLKREAETRGVDPSRLVFAPRRPPPDHLARHRLADLFLDTSPCNAHTTASDALWAGLPVLSCRGQYFAGRVAASLLRAIGLPELITDDLASYEALALRLAQVPAELAILKSRLARTE